MQLRERDKAPDFTARSSDGETFHLGRQLREYTVVLSFYPQDFSFGCTRQLCSYRNRYQEFLKLGARVIGVSVDEKSSHERFRAEYKFPFPLISDPDRSLARAYGVDRFRGLPGLLGLRPRVTFIIDREMIIRKIIRHNVRFTDHVEDALTILRAMGEGTS